MPLTRRPQIVGALLIFNLSLAGCSDPREDVRVTLCKDMTAVELGAAPSWNGSEVATNRYQGAAVTLRFAAAGSEGRSVCRYEHAAKDDTAIELANPLEAYSTSPSGMTLNGRTLSRQELARAVKRAMEKQGRELVDRVQKVLRPE